MHTEVHAVKGNMRYRMVEIDENYYLLDIEENVWFFLFPFLSWFHKYKIYAIDEAQAQYFMKSKERQDKGEKEKTKAAFLVPLMIPFSIIFGRILIDMGINDISYFQSKAVNIATLILIFLGISYFWRAMYK